MTSSARQWVIIPTLNEEKNLGWILPELVKLYQVIVVDNGSTDQSSDIAKKLGAHVVTSSPKGYGRAVWDGLQYARQVGQDSDLIIIFDADGTSPLQRIPDLIKPLLKGRFDMVIGQRDFLQLGAMPIHGKFGNWLTTNLIWFFTGKKYRDMGPLRALRLGTFNQLQMQDRTWGWNVEMQMKAVFQKLTVLEIPIVYQLRKYGHSKISGSLKGTLRAGTRIIWSTFYFWAKQTFTSSENKALSVKSDAS